MAFVPGSGPRFLSEQGNRALPADARQRAVRLAVPTESRADERRVAIVPDVVRRLAGKGWQVTVQSGAGTAADFPDASYEEAGATVAPGLGETLAEATVVAKVNAPSAEEAGLMPEGAAELSFLQPAASVEALEVLARRRCTVFSFDLLPRISRAQGMDALSSQSTVSGYRATLVGAEALGKFFPMFMTAAGTVPPAKVLVMGVGVAGLQAIATARRLGAVVRAYDVRAAAREEAESLGAKFVDLGESSAEGQGGYARELSPEELERQRQALADEVAASDVLITTAAVPGRPAPVLVTTPMVERMGPGAIVVDMAADSGGNVEPSEAGREIDLGGVRVIGMANPPAGMPNHASFLYARNVANVLDLLVKDGSFAPDWNDEIVAGTCVLRGGAAAHQPTAELLGAPHAPIGGTEAEVSEVAD